MRDDAKVTTGLRLLCTSDLHMAIDGSRLLADGNAQLGLAALARPILQARAEVGASLLFDLGDAFQGSPLTDDLDVESIGAGHPMQQAIDALGFDGQTLGNHDLDFGLSYLRAIRKTARTPMVCANLHWIDGGPVLPTRAMQRVQTDGGQSLLVGFTGALPPRVMRWNRHHLCGRVTVEEIAPAIRREAVALREEGAHIVVILAHTGIVPHGHPDEDEHTVLAISAIDEVDAILCGHQHRLFPGADFRAIEGIDPIRGVVNGKPCIMPGWQGDRIGVLDLLLERVDDGAWRVGSHDASFRRAAVEADPCIEAIAAPHVARTRTRLSTVISRTEKPLDTTFASVADVAAVRAVQAAMWWKARPEVEADLPLVAVTAAVRNGGRGGPQHFTRIPAGELTERAVADLCPFANHNMVVAATGGDLRRWLEMGSTHIAQLHSTRPAQSFVNPDMPGYSFDGALGVTYAIDPTRPHRFDASGRLANPEAHRIVDLRLGGEALADDRPVAIVASTYRLAGGGNFPGLDVLPPLTGDLGLTHELVADWMAAHPRGLPLPGPSWTFRPSHPVSAILRTGAGEPPPETGAELQHLGSTSDGWHDWRVVLTP
ncbi:5'-nucleotidase C-terminal domain-containing protein [Roseobacter sp. HKCCA0434]|uniref:5'-nucleotidase C-terminal domain-containing protein n=1 Tax=Roseobacter sp. HKCCA0434 TaxID=3079297 RepID=UPI002905DC82|nr:5'-nucleotidase C-terminal domain-containing protein [Roseobacter sp. HKCCA0434]